MCRRHRVNLLFSDFSSITPFSNIQTPLSPSPTSLSLCSLSLSRTSLHLIAQSTNHNKNNRTRREEIKLRFTSQTTTRRTTIELEQSKNPTGQTQIPKFQAPSMAKSKTFKKQHHSSSSYISVPSHIFASISLLSQQKPTKPISKHPSFKLKTPILILLCLLIIALFISLNIHFNLLDTHSPVPLISHFPRRFIPMEVKIDEKDTLLNGVEETDSGSFWGQVDGMGYKGCLGFSREYRKASEVGAARERRRYLMVVVSGGLNQQRNQIVDAVVIARVLGATLVVPVLQVNVIWGDESEFSDIFDLEHFKSVLADDVRIVSSLPSTYLRKRPVEASQTPFHASPRWLQQHYGPRLRRDGLLLIRGLDSRLSNDLPSDLQKLKCKVAFHALKFAPRILELGNRLAERMQSHGPYLALHLRMEKDVWVRTGCSPGLSTEFDEIIENERRRHPELLTAKSNMTAHERKLAGLCPLNALEFARLLKALDAPRNARIYWAGGQPLGGKEALLPLTREFPQLYNKEDLALPGELEPFAAKASIMAAIDYIVCEKSDVFMPSHGGNMGHALQGHRAYAGHKKYITPNKRQMLLYFMNSSLPEAEFNRIIKELHQDSLGQPELKTSRMGRDVTKYPVPECMCNTTDAHSS